MYIWHLYTHANAHSILPVSSYICHALSHTQHALTPIKYDTDTYRHTQIHTPSSLPLPTSVTHTHTQHITHTHTQHTLTPNRYEAIVTFGRIEETNVNLRLTFFLKTYKSGTSKTTIERENLANVWGHQCRENTQHLYEKKKVLFERIEMSHITSRKCHELHYLNVTNAYHLNLTNTLHVTDTTLECHEHYSKPII